MVDIASHLSEHDSVARLIAILKSDTREQIRELVILFLRPLLEGMVVASGTGELLPQESLRRILGDFDGILMQDEIIQLAGLTCIPR